MKTGLKTDDLRHLIGEKQRFTQRRWKKLQLNVKTCWIIDEISLEFS